MTDTIRDNPALSRFELALDGGTAVVNYRLSGETLVLTHTEVPWSLRERGIGSRIVEGVLDIARARGQKVVPRCSFVANVIAQQPRYRDLLA